MRVTKLLTPMLFVAALTVSSCSATASSGSAAGSFGDCKVSGTKGEFNLKTVTPDTLTIKADLPSRGWYNGDTVESIRSGFDYCLAANIAHRAGLTKIKLEHTSFDGLVAGKTGSFDLSLNQITVTEKRRSVIDFSDPYFDSTAGILAKSDTAITEDTLRDQKLGVKQGTVGQILVTESVKPAKEVSVFPADAEMGAAILAGRVDAGVQDLSLVLAMANQSGGKLKVLGQIPTGEKYAALLPKGSPNLETVNKIIARVHADGTLKELASTYLTAAYGIDPETVPVWSAR